MHPFTLEAVGIQQNHFFINFLVVFLWTNAAKCHLPGTCAMSCWVDFGRCPFVSPNPGSDQLQPIYHRSDAEADWRQDMEFPQNNCFVT